MTERKNYFHKKYLYLSIIFIVVIIGIIFVVYKQKSVVINEQDSDVDIIRTSEQQQKNIVINGQTIYVAIADTADQRQQGLGGQKTLCEKCGMLFLFDTVDNYTFWMKDMNFDIDIIWIRDDVVVDISDNVSYKTSEKIVWTIESIDKVLELPAGSADKFGIIAGNGVHY